MSCHEKTIFFIIDDKTRVISPIKVFADRDNKPVNAYKMLHNDKVVDPDTIIQCIPVEKLTTSGHPELVCVMSIVDRTFRKHFSMQGDKKHLDYDAIYKDMYADDRYSFIFSSLLVFPITPLGKRVRLLTKAGAYTDGKKFLTILLTKERYTKIFLSKSLHNCIINSDTNPEFFDASDPLMKQRLVDFIIDRARLWVDLLEVEDWAGEKGNRSDSDGSETSDSGDVISDSDFSDSDLDLDMSALPTAAANNNVVN